MNHFDKKKYFLALSVENNAFFILGVRLFEIICGTLIVCLLAMTVATHQRLYNYGKNYSGIHSVDSIPLWIILGIIVSIIGIFISTIFVINRIIRFSLVEFISSIIMIIAYNVILVLGIMNTPYKDECYKSTEIRRVRCVAPKIVIFFSFIAIISYIISAIVSGRVYLDRRKNS